MRYKWVFVVPLLLLLLLRFFAEPPLNIGLFCYKQNGVSTSVELVQIEKTRDLRQIHRYVHTGTYVVYPTI
jgi:hypothetical protein